MLALRVPCDARMSRRDAELAIAQTRRIPNSPAHPVLLGEPERDSSFRHASSRNPFFTLSGYRPAPV